MTKKKSKDNVLIASSKSVNKKSNDPSKMFPKRYNHNEFWTDFFMDLSFARVMFRHILSQDVLSELDLRGMTIVNPTLITQFLQIRYCDIVYKVPLKSHPDIFVYLLVDFKSNNSQDTVLQLFEYSYNLCFRPLDKRKRNARKGQVDDNIDPNIFPIQLSNSKKYPLTSIISVVLHSGKSKFTSPTKISGLFNLPLNSILFVKSIDYGFDLFDLNILSESQLPKAIRAYVFCRTSQISYMEDVNEKAFVLFDKIKEKLCVNKKLCKSWDKCLYYLFTSSKHFTYETYKQLITSTQQIGVKVMSTSAAKKYYAEATRIGRTEGIAKGIAKGEARGIARGRTEGRAKGIAEGIARGEVKGEAKSIIRILRKRLDEPSIELQNKIMNIQSISKLDELLDFAFNCVSLGEFETAFN